MKCNLKRTVLSTLLALTSLGSVMAQDEVTVDFEGELVSSYIWRGQEIDGISMQPSLAVGYKGFTLGAWGSMGLENFREVDLSLSYNIGGLTLSFNDYWCFYEDEPTKYLNYNTNSTGHTFDFDVCYDFGPLAISWSTVFAGADIKENGERAYSSYVNVSAPFSLGGMDWTAGIGATPWKTNYYENTNGFSVCEVSLRADKEVKITDQFGISAFGQIICNPATENVFFVCGLAF